MFVKREDRKSLRLNITEGRGFKVLCELKVIASTAKNQSSDFYFLSLNTLTA